MKSTTKQPLAHEQWSEHQASLFMARNSDQNKQEGIKAMNMETDRKEAARKQSVNEQFWHSIKQVVFVIACAAFAIYTLIHFA